TTTNERRASRSTPFAITTSPVRSRTLTLFRTAKAQSMSKLLLIRDTPPCQIHRANQTYGHPCTTNQILAAGERGRHCYKSSRIQPQADEPRRHHVRPPP